VTRTIFRNANLLDGEHAARAGVTVYASGNGFDGTPFASQSSSSQSVEIGYSSLWSRR
jgi:hypothetical protein